MHTADDGLFLVFRMGPECLNLGGGLRFRGDSFRLALSLDGIYLGRGLCLRGFRSFRQSGRGVLPGLVQQPGGLLPGFRNGGIGPGFGGLNLFDGFF